MDKRGTRGLAALVCAAGMLPALALGGPAQAAPVTCWGEAATIVSDDEQVRGTPGDDVIVTTRPAAEVASRAGDDTICVRGRRGVAFVDPGRGDDRVRIEARKVAFTDLRQGSDTYVGGPGRDEVLSGLPRGQRNDDRIRLGAGDDHLLLGGAGSSRRAALSAGTGDDTLTIGAGRGAVLVDAAAERATYRGRAHATWNGFESHVVAGARVLFRGTEGEDDVTLAGNAVSADLLAGDDTVTVLASASGNLRARLSDSTTGPDALDGALSRFLSRHLPARRGTGGAAVRARTAYDLDPGDGHDQLRVLSDAVGVTGSLVTDRVVLTDVSGARAEVPATGFEGLASRTVFIDGETTAELEGDELDNTLEANACRVVLRGGPGDDRLRVGSEATDESFILTVLGQDCARTSEVHGDAGDDTLVSRLLVPTFRSVVHESDAHREVRVRDLLDGGEGTDSADAGLGNDTCVAEVRVACEQ
ncbi:hypothetical protein HN031_03915 [Nocardioides sp. zg-1308]|uniref:hypothetical protein n=1 Tax=Nocardioides sp. zg-1308 TaxID=2736253 RepID=UPI001553F592|nr:hypothetical protein [Nocardioides sp. zg-1308]NPD03831.1 hypothetical protein [Nocardioides sp. zg-1308]